MPTVVRFHVVTPFLAIRPSAKSSGLVTVPEGATIEVPGDLHEPGLHLMKLGKEHLFAFTRDIEERAKPLDLAPADSDA